MNQDPRITAYAVGELEARERESFETELAASDSLHHEVESMSGLAKQLASAAKPTDRFTAGERVRLLAKCAAIRRARTVAKTSLKVVLWTTLGVAACLTIFAGLIVGMMVFPSSSPQSAPAEVAIGSTWIADSSDQIASPRRGSDIELAPAEPQARRAGVISDVAAAISATPAASASVRTYKVQPGDTLGSIARRFYKNSGQWQKIVEANKGALSDPTKLKQGTVLIIPE